MTVEAVHKSWPWKKLLLAGGGLLIIVLLIVIWIIHAGSPATTAKSLQAIPKGVFTGWQSASVAQQSTILQDTDIVGVGVGPKWEDLEPGAGSYSWSALDTSIKTLEGHKKILLRITSGGKNTPDWVKNESQQFSFTDTNSYHKTSGDTVTIPVFWDPNFLSAKTQMIKDVAAHLAGKQIDIVAASCANASTNDWNPASKSSAEYNNWLSLGYTADKLIGACDQIIDTTADAFPNSYVSVSVGSSGAFDTSPNYIATTVLAHAKVKYHGRIIVEKNALSAITPAPSEVQSANGGSWHLIVDNKPNIAGQMLWSATHDSSCRMNGGRAPCDPHTVLSAAVKTGAEYGMKYEEIYTSDALNPALADVIKQAGSLLANN